MPVTLTDDQRAVIRGSLNTIKAELSGLRSEIDEQETGGSEPSSLEHDETSEHIATLDDTTLVWVMFALLSNSDETSSDWRPIAGATRNSAILTRIVFGEIAVRWLPAEVVGEAFTKLGLDGDA